jgi:FAD/FMN-containing dehydrogenase
MAFKKITEQDLNYFKEAIGAAYVFTDTASIDKYSKDETVDAEFAPEVVLKPISAEEISKMALQQNI